jgi:protein-tyrosine-phosphatase
LGGVDRGRNRAGPYEKGLLRLHGEHLAQPHSRGIFNALVSDRDMPFEAQSAGRVGLTGEPMAPYTRATLEEVGVYTEGNRARRVDANMLEESNLASAMTAEHASTLRPLFGVPREDSHLARIRDWKPSL